MTDITNNIEEEVRHDVGTFASNKKGFGFIRPDDGEADIFVAAKNTNSAFHNDKVQFQIIKPGSEDSNPEGKIIDIVERTITELVGTYSASEKFGFVKADIKNVATDIFIPGKNSMRAQNNDKVLVRIVNYGSQGKRPEGKVIEILGSKGDPGIDVLSVIKAKGIPTDFPDEVLAQAHTIPTKVSEKEIEGRQDFRDLLTVTIDGASTKDFDDAMSLSKEGDIYHLGIHIADVTNYVLEGSPIDKEASYRGTSVYPVDRVIPMIPEELSLGICSLVEGEDRLTLSCMMDFDKDGKMLSRRIVPAVIRVDYRMTYDQVSEMLDNHKDYMEGQYKELMPILLETKELTDKFRAIKAARGAVDFEFAEPEITLDENGHAINIEARRRNKATMIIEELMLKANETVAEIANLDEDWYGTPLIYRSHEAPDPDRMEILKKLVMSLGHRFEGDIEDIQPANIQSLVEECKGSKEELLITTMTLRSMKRAMYSTASKKAEEEIEGEARLKPVGHFGLAAEYYCHFTSPIRRYPDLVNHRIIKKKLAGQLTEEDKNTYKKKLPDLVQHICETEHRAIETERDSNKIKMAEYMHDREGQIFEGTISGMAGWGLYVSLPNSVEGLIPVASIGDGYYNFDEERMIMLREDGGRYFSIGDPVKVKVTESDPELRIIDFELVKE